MISLFYFLYPFIIRRAKNRSVSVAKIRNMVEKFQQFPKRFVRKGAWTVAGPAVRRNQRLNWTLSLYV